MMRYRSSRTAPGANLPWLMESEAVSHPLDDAGFDGARPDEAAGARTVSPCGAAIVIASASFGCVRTPGRTVHPQIDLEPQPGQTTAGFYLAFAGLDCA